MCIILCFVICEKIRNVMRIIVWIEMYVRIWDIGTIYICAIVLEGRYATAWIILLRYDA